MEEAEFDCYAGLDWASQKHRVVLLDGTGKLRGRRDVAHRASDYAALCRWLLQAADGQAARVAVAIETTHGPAVEALLEHGFAVYAINPRQLDRFRERFTLAGAKDDDRDAYVMARSLRTDRDAFRRLAVDDPRLIQLRELSRRAGQLQQDRGRLTNRLREQLWRYYPQMLELNDALDAPWVLALWQQAPRPEQGARLQPQTITRILRQHRIRKIDAEQVRAILRQPPLVVAAGVREAAIGHIRQLLAQLRLLNQQILAVHRAIDALCAELAGPQVTEPGQSVPGQSSEQRDVTILRSLPGIARIVLAALLGEASAPLHRRDYPALRLLSGVAPVTKRSGKSCIVLRRLACNWRLSNAVYHWARVAAQVEPTSRARYQALLARGCSHGRALRSVGDRLLRVACTLLERQQLFDPAHPVAALDAAPLPRTT